MKIKDAVYNVGPLDQRGEMVYANMMLQMKLTGQINVELAWAYLANRLTHYADKLSEAEQKELGESIADLNDDELDAEIKRAQDSVSCDCPSCVAKGDAERVKKDVPNPDSELNKQLAKLAW